VLKGFMLVDMKQNELTRESLIIFNSITVKEKAHGRYVRGIGSLKYKRKVRRDLGRSRNRWPDHIY
jgi:hypothetical protein